MLFFWVIATLGSILGGLFAFIGILNAKSAPQEATAVLLGLGAAVIPYCLARAVSAIRNRSTMSGGIPVGSKTCPQCAEPVRSEAKSCRFCQFIFLAVESDPRSMPTAASNPPERCPKCGSPYFHEIKGQGMWECDSSSCSIKFLVPGAAAILAVVLLAGAAIAAEIQILDDQGRDQGVAREARPGQLDLFKADGRREGYGVQRSDGSWDIYNNDGSRRATITPGIAGQPSRITIQPSRRK